MKKLLASALALMLAATPALASYGGSSSIGSSLSRDNCPNGDYSISYYDGTCDDDSVASDDDTNGVTLDGFIYFDDNKNGAFDASEIGVQGAIVTLKTVSNAIVDTDVSSSAGYYAFYNVGAGTYKIHVSIPAQLTALETILALVAPSVNAQSDYEFTVVVGADESGTKTVGYTPIVDGVIASSVSDDEEEMEEEMMEEEMEEESDDDISSILDLINDANDDSAPTVTSSVNNNPGGSFVAPTMLPQTGASL